MLRARSSDWESAALARQRPRVQIPVGPFYFPVLDDRIVFIFILFIGAAPIRCELGVKGKNILSCLLGV